MNVSWTPSEDFDEYRIIRKLGSGAMGEVYLAYDTLLDRHVAVKFLASFELDPARRARFLVEARAAARLQHPNVVAVHRVGELKGRPYLISEFVRGQSLEKLPKPIPWTRVLDLAIGLVRGLGAAHRRGVLHRDIKPANTILADDGNVKLLDFGLAKIFEAPEERALGAETYREGAVGDLISVHARTFVTGGGSAMDDTLPFPEAEASVHGNDPDHGGRPDDGHVFTRLSRTGAIMGTPCYLPPEIWAGEAATQRSDIYSLGAMLYELMAGYPPHFARTPDSDPPLGDLGQIALRVTTMDAPPLASVAEGVDVRFASIVDRCLCRKPEGRFPSTDVLLEALIALTPGAAPSPAAPEGNPYRGLHAFEAQHRAVFFGRAAEIREVLERLRYDNFVLVVGDSGVGKSSLCRAGVLPLVPAEIGQKQSCAVIRLVPGKHPLAALSAHLSPHFDTMEEDVIRSAPHPRGDERTQGRVRAESGGMRLRKLKRDQGGLVIFIDQLEELVSLSDPEEASLFSDTLLRLVMSTPGVRVLATARSDFLTRLAALPGLGEEITRAIYVLRPLTPSNIREAIVGPAMSKGVRFEAEGLVDALVATTTRAEGGGLPLLQFALAELWEARDAGRGVIPWSALHAIGGVEGALARHADSVLESLLPPQRAAVRRVMRRLVTSGGTRARQSRAGLVAEDPLADAAIEALVRGRLLVARELDEDTSYEIAHEALIEGWGTLRGWLESESEERFARERLAVASVEWERLGRAREGLWSERQLEEVKRLDPVGLAPGERAFLQASRVSLRRRRLRTRAVWMGLPLAAALVYGGIQVQARRETRRAADAHLERARTSLSEARRSAGDLVRVRNDAFATFDAGDIEKAENRWALARKSTDEVDHAYRLASEAVEAALLIDPSRAVARRSLGEVLYERALLAESAHRFAQVDELLLRLSHYDAMDELRSRWQAPARLSLETSPGGALVSFGRYVEDEKGALRLESLRALGTTPIVKARLEPGSYLFVLEAPGRVGVRYPILLQRGEDRTASIDLLEVAEVPDGMLYIPRGRFLFGTSSNEQLRRDFYHTAPLHEVDSGSYLIAKHETTYAEWIAFLESLPPTERRRHTPGATPGLQGGVTLTETGHGEWRLEIEPTQERYSSQPNGTIVYKNRDRRKSQQWLALPVSYVSWDDAVAYARWADRSGRIPGARLCTEHEWERAARGADGREFPHGSALGPDDANHDATYGRQPLAMGPDEVGSHPASRSPFGVDDLAGNVWEWVAASLSAEKESLIRGGGYFYGETTCRSVNRERVDPIVRDVHIGFRICASVRATLP